MAGSKEINSSYKNGNWVGVKPDSNEIKKKIKWLKMIQKVVFHLGLLILIIILLIQTVQCVIKFMQGPTYISSEIVPQKAAGFPAMTVCPNSDGYREDVFQAHGIEEVDRYNYKRDLNWTSNQTGVTEEQLFELATYGFDELVKRLYIRFFEADENGKTSMVLDLSDAKNNSNVQEQRHRSFGRCYTIHPDLKIQQLGVYYYKMDLHQDSKVYFHRSGQFLDLSGRMGYKILIGDVVQSQVSWHDIRMMSKEKDDGRSMTCIESEYDQCMYGSLVKHMESSTLDEGGCTAPWIMNGTIGTSKICKNAENINTTFWIAWNRVTNQLQDCPVPCESLLVSLGAKNYQFKDERTYGQFYLYFAPRTMFSQELILYTPLSMFAEIGGYVGLLLGVSIWNFAAWISDILESKIKSLEKDL